MYDDVLRELETNLSLTYGSQITCYSDGYIDDVFSEMANSNIDIYVSDLFEWCKRNFEYIDKATQEFGDYVTSLDDNDILDDINSYCSELNKDMEL